MLEPDIERARECYKRGAWSEAHQLLALADQASALAAADLELLAVSAYMIGRDAEFYSYHERAHHRHLKDSEYRRAARCAFWLGLMLMMRGDDAQANGWLARAQRLVEGSECVERGYLLLPAAEVSLVERDSGAALAAAVEAVEIGSRYADADLTACALHLQGRALIQLGQVSHGLELLDESMVAASGGELSPMLTGLLYCSVIDVCRQVFALSRAREWTFALERWCAKQPEMVAFSGICLIDRAALMQFGGSWEAALNEARHAHGRFVEAGAHTLLGVAFYQQGEIHRLRGDFDAAEDGYRHASRLGSEPLPGLALLRMAQGRIDAAFAAINRVLSATSDPLVRARLLPAYVDIALCGGKLKEALDAAAELEQIALRFPTDVLQAMAAHARGAVELALGRAETALVALRRAFKLWQRTEAPYETARVRLLIALTCRELGDSESASLEFDGAAALLERLGAAPDLGNLDALRKRAMHGSGHGLTSREIQVLRQIAAGKTNKAIATEFVVSERTVDRHVSNILTKLGVPSRAAAAAYAVSQKLL